MGKAKNKAFDCVDLKNAVQAEIGEEESLLGTAEAERLHDLWVRTSEDPLAAWWRAVLGLDVAERPSPRGRKKRAVVILCCALLSLIASKASADVADVIPVGGVLTDKSGAPLDGDFDMLFALYDVQIGGTPLWYEQYDASNQIHVSDGVFSAELGSLTTIDFLDLISASELWLGITVGADSEAGRIRIGSVPYAFEAQYCHQVLGSTCPVGQYLRGWDDATSEAICDGAGSMLPVGGSSNCRLSLSGSSLGIVGSTGAALGATNACVVRVTDGAVATFASPVATTFGGSSDSKRSQGSGPST